MEPGGNIFRERLLVKMRTMIAEAVDTFSFVVSKPSRASTAWLHVSLLILCVPGAFLQSNWWAGVLTQGKGIKGMDSCAKLKTLSLFRSTEKKQHFSCLIAISSLWISAVCPGLGMWPRGQLNNLVGMQGSDVTFHNVISQSFCNFAGGAAAGRIRSLAAGLRWPYTGGCFPAACMEHGSLGRLSPVIGVSVACRDGCSSSCRDPGSPGRSCPVRATRPSRLLPPRGGGWGRLMPGGRPQLRRRQAPLWWPLTAAFPSLPPAMLPACRGPAARGGLGAGGAAWENDLAFYVLWGLQEPPRRLSRCGPARRCPSTGSGCPGTRKGGGAGPAPGGALSRAG